MVQVDISSNLISHPKININMSNIEKEKALAVLMHIEEPNEAARIAGIIVPIYIPEGTRFKNKETGNIGTVDSNWASHEVENVAVIDDASGQVWFSPIYILEIIV